jgi:predicted O-methyltransferase YrrM
MSNESLSLAGDLYRYYREITLREDELLRRLREETSQMPKAQMQIAPEQGQFFSLLIQVLNARRTLELGVFTGYSSICIARALPHDGRIIACDISEEWTSVARRYWEEAGVAEKIDLRLAPAIETLDGLLESGQVYTFDFAFIDADKSNYDIYYERCLRLVRTGGVIAIDNVLWSGKVADTNVNDADTLALRTLNTKLNKDERVSLSVLPIADGVTLALKR